MTIEELRVVIKAETDKFQKQLDGVNKSLGKVNSQATSMGKSLKKVGKIMLALFSIRSISQFIVQLMKVNSMADQFQATIGAAKTALSDAFTPILQNLVRLFARIMGFVAGFFSALTKSKVVLGKTEKTVGKIATMYAGFDELNVIGSQDSGGGADPSADFAAIAEGMEMGRELFDKILKLLSPVIDAFGKLSKALEPLNKKIGGGIVWLWENFLVPVGEWGINEALPKFLEAVGSAAGVLNNVLDAAQPVFDWFWNKILVPIGKWTGDKFIKALDFINAGLEKFGNWVQDHQKLIEFLIILVGSLAAGFVIATIAVTAWNAVAGIGAVVTGALAGAVAFLTSPFTLAVAAIGAVIAIGILLWKNWDTVKEKASELWTSIKNIFGKIPEWFKEQFTKAWTNVKNVFSTGGKIFDGIKEGITEAFKKVVNGIITGINKVVAVPFNAINTVLSKIKSVSVLGVKPFSWVGTISVPKIPQLALGGSVDPGQLFVAGESGAEMLGSHKGKTTVMPLENTDFTAAMGQAVREGVLDAMMSAEGGDIVLNVDGMVLARATEKSLNKLSQAKGGLNIAF